MTAITIALAYKQSQLSLNSTVYSADHTLSGSGYGPPNLRAPSPVLQLVRDALENRKEASLICLAITNDRWRERWERMCVVQDSADQKRLSNRLSVLPSQNDVEAENWRAGAGFRRGEVNVTRAEESQHLIGLVSDWLELDSAVEGIRFDSEIALKQEIAYASHLHIVSVIMPPLRNPDHVHDYARAVNACLSASAYIHIAVPIPVSWPAAELSFEQAASLPWDLWNTIRQACAYSSRLHLALDFTNPLPPLELLSRWQAEPLRVLWIPANAFLPNAKGYPVLSKGTQSFLKSLFKFKPTVVLSATDEGVHSAGGPEAYAQYIRFLERKQPEQTPVEAYAGPYLDYLQTPLQPLQDNLETNTYEGFEKDPIKYQQYEEAVYQALMDRPTGQTIDIFVCGAGRGPLVAGCLKAAKRAGNRSVKIVAVEKNANAFVILQERKAIEWGELVDLYFTDMRSFEPDTQADIIVSELLGSFGDNELSPECLDGVIPRLLKPGGVSIPHSYTAFLAPLSSSKLYESVTATSDTDKAEQPYVVMFHRATIVSEAKGDLEKIQGCWSFHHPVHNVVLDSSSLPLTNSHNSRSAHLRFHIPNATVCHGFAGYFEATLYGHVMLSIHPERTDSNMLSWFPMFFPLREPLYLPSNCELDVYIWRLTDQIKRRIWFEWSAEAYMTVQQPVNAPASKHGSLSPHTPMSGSGTSFVDAFASAPSSRVATPHLMNSSVSSAQSENAQHQLARVKINATRLHNPLGKASWVGL